MNQTCLLTAHDWVFHFGFREVEGWEFVLIVPMRVPRREFFSHSRCLRCGEKRETELPREAVSHAKDPVR